MYSAKLAPLDNVSGPESPQISVVNVTAAPPSRFQVSKEVDATFAQIPQPRRRSFDWLRTPSNKLDDGPPNDNKEAEKFTKILKVYEPMGMSPNSTKASVAALFTFTVLCYATYLYLASKAAGFRQ